MDLVGKSEYILRKEDCNIIGLHRYDIYTLVGFFFVIFFCSLMFFKLANDHSTFTGECKRIAHSVVKKFYWLVAPNRMTQKEYVETAL